MAGRDDHRCVSVRSAGLSTARALRLALALREPDADAKTGRVAQLARAVAIRLGTSEEAASIVELAASVKDIGRLAIPDELLTRPGRLAAHEWSQVSGHVMAAEGLLVKIPELRVLAPIVGSAHERWDGQGYPRGQTGESIPLPSRIIAACDAYVAMTSGRPFREAIDEATALHQVMEIAGTQLDPTVAKALVAEFRGPRKADPRHAPADSEAISASNGSVGKDLVAKLDLLEPIPALLLVRDRLLEALAVRHPNMEDVVSQLECDPGLALFALRSANAASVGATISSIPEAISVLGWVELKRVVEDAPALDFLWPHNPWEAALAEFRLHAVAVQRAAVRLADAGGYGALDVIAISALLHDVGRLALTQLRSGYMGRLRSVPSADERLRLERRDFGIDHATVGGLVARRYGLPGALAGVISDHHNDEAGEEARLVCLADALAHHRQSRSALPVGMIELGDGLGVAPDELRAIAFELPHVDGSRRTRGQPCPLSPCEQEALQALAEGKVYGEIARGLGVQTSTVRSHLQSVYRKLDVTDRAQAVLMATERGWVV